MNLIAEKHAKYYYNLMV